MTFCDDVGDTLQLPMHLTDFLYGVSFRIHRPLKSPLSCEVSPKRWFLGPDLYEEGIAQILDMRFQITLTSDHLADLG